VKSRPAPDSEILWKELLLGSVHGAFEERIKRKVSINSKIFNYVFILNFPGMCWSEAICRIKS